MQSFAGCDWMAILVGYFNNDRTTARGPTLDGGGRITQLLLLAGRERGRTIPLTDFPSCSFLSRNEFCLRKANEQLRNSVSGHSFAE